MTIRPVAITMGDPNGIGPEIVAKAFGAGGLEDCLVIGDASRIDQAVQIAGAEIKVETLNGLDDVPPSDALRVLQVGPDTSGSPFGLATADAGRASFSYLEAGIEAALSGAISALVTAPIHKEAWSKAGISFPGHTEVLAERAGGVPVAMMLANTELRVVLVTIHVSLREACDLITFERELVTIRQAHSAGIALGFAAPRVAIAGLNPHAGESGLFGREEIEIITPAISAARAEGIDASGPWPGDTIFGRARKGAFDVVVAQTHDQGLIPVKYLGIDDGVNITFGLPFVRTSPDHGTAFDIAGTGVAAPDSLLKSIDYARRLKVERAASQRAE